MTPKQEKFVSEYLVDLNATQAAIRAGYAAKWAEKNATRLTGNDGIAKAVAAGLAKQLDECELTAKRTLQEIARIAYSDIGDVFDENDHLRPISTLKAKTRAVLASAKVLKTNLVSGDGVREEVHEVKLWDKLKALDMAAKYHGLLTEKVEHSGEVSIRWQSDGD